MAYMWVDWRRCIAVIDRNYRYPAAKLVHLSNVVLVSGEVPASGLPCGVNCTYDIYFEGPAF